MPDNSPEANAAHWRRTRGLTIFVLLIWVVFAFVVHVFASYLNQFTFLGFPLGYYMAVQGSLIVFVVLIFFQNAQQDAIDDDYGHDH
jgi:putative solute:sodium symporter small subunit